MPLSMAVAAPIDESLTVRWGERRAWVFGCVLLGFVAHGFSMGVNRPSFTTTAAAGALDSSTTGVGMAVLRMCSALDG